MSDLAGPIAGLVLLSPFAIVGYGFYDAYATTQVDPSIVDVRVAPVSWMQLYYDSMGPYGDRQDSGDIFLKVEWTSEPGKRVAQIWVSGSAFLDGGEIEQFAGLCQRRGSTTLRHWPELPVTDPTCFYRLEATLPHKKGPDGKAVDQSEREGVYAQIRVIELRDLQARVDVSNAPMKFVSWLQERYRSVRDTIMSPFEREV